MRKIFALGSVLLLLFCLLPAFQVPVLADNENPNAQGKIMGPWNITMLKSYKDTTIEVCGNITIKAGGNLTLDHVKLIINSTKKAEYYIVVETGGTLQILNNSLVTNNATFDKPYFLTASFGSTVTIQRSQLRRMGNTTATIGLATLAKMGFLLQSSGATVSDSVIADSFAGTVCMSILLPITPKILNVTYRNDSLGLGISLNCNPTLLGNTFIKDAAGLAVILKGKTRTSLSKDRFYNNTLAVGATASSMGLSDVIIENSTDIGIGAMAGSMVDATNVVLRNNKNATHMDNSTLVMSNSLVTKSGKWDFFVDNVSNVKATNTTIDSRSKIKVNDTGSIFELQWHLNVRAQFKNGTALTGAIINVTDALGKRVFGTVTDSKGWSGQILVTELKDQGVGAVKLTPHNVTAEKGAYWNLTKVTVDRSQDLVLNVWQRDIVPPQVIIESPGNGAYVNSTKLDVNGTASDNAAVALVEVSNGTGGWAKATGTTSWSGIVNLTGDGPHQVCARAKDTSNNTATSCIPVTLDTVSPTIKVTEPKDGTYFNHSQLFVKGTSNGDIVQVGSDTVVVFNGNFSYPLTLMKEGANDIVLVAKDVAGNQNRTTLRLYRDLVSPTLTVLSPQSGATVPTNAFVVAGNVSDAQGVAGLWGSSDNRTWKAADVHYSSGANTSGTYTASFSLPEGNYTLYLKANDRANNTVRVQFKVRVKLPDVAPPILAIASPKDGQRITGLKFTVNGTAKDDEAVAKVELSLDGIIWNQVDTKDGWAHWSINVTLLEGTNTIYVRAFDTSGNKAVALVTVTAVKPFVDTERPVVSITSPKDGSTVSKQKVVLKGQVSDNVKVKTVLVSTTGSGSGANWILATLGPGNTTWSMEVTLKSGWNLVAVKASDDVGNTNITNVTIKYEKPQSSTALNYWVFGILLIVILVLIVVYVMTLPGRERAKKAKDEPVSEDEEDEAGAEEE